VSRRNKLTELGWVFTVFTGIEIHRDVGWCVEPAAKTYAARARQVRGPQGVPKHES
jgi:hypothetical protein